MVWRYLHQQDELRYPGIGPRTSHKVFEQQVVDAARDNVEGLVGQKLREAQIPYKKVEAVMDTSSSDSIGISKLIVTTDNPEDKIRIQKYLEEHLQIQTEVAVE